MISRRSLEVGTALLTGAFGTAVLISSLDNGVSWTRSGIEAGTFPFVMGAIVAAASLYNMISGWLHASPGVMLDWRTLKRVGALFIPACFFVAAIPLLGMHLSAGLYVFCVLLPHHSFTMWKKVTLSIGTMLALYLIFDQAFKVDLPPGLLETALGF